MTKPVKFESRITSRHELENKILDLRRDRGKAIIAGRKFNNAVIGAAERDLAMLEDAEAERAHLAREAAEKKHHAQRKEMRSALAALELVRLQDLKDCEDSTRALAAAFERVLDANEQMSKLAFLILGEAPPTPLSGPDLKNRLSARLSSIMTTIPNCRARFGFLEWKGSSLYSPDQDWAESERRHLEPHLKRITKGEKK